MSEITCDDVCQQVFVSGVCAHPDNEEDRMHTCAEDYNHLVRAHRCACGKEWKDSNLTIVQYLQAAFIKAVE